MPRTFNVAGRAGERDPLARGLAQLDAYLERLGLKEGNGRGGQKPKRSRAKAPSGQNVTLLRM